MSNLILCCKVKSKLQLTTQIQSFTFLQCLPQIARLVAPLKISLRIMVLEEEGVGIISIEAEEEAGLITMVVDSMPTILIPFRIFLHRIFRIKAQLLPRITNLIVHLAKSMGNQAIKLWIVFIGWILHFKARILLPSLLPWLVLLMQPSQTIKILGLQIQVLLIILLQTSTTFLFSLNTKGLNKSLWAMVSLSLSIIQVMELCLLNIITSSLKMSFMCLGQL